MLFAIAVDCFAIILKPLPGPPPDCAALDGCAAPWAGDTTTNAPPWGGEKRIVAARRRHGRTDAAFLPPPQHRTGDSFYGECGGK